MQVNTNKFPTLLKECFYFYSEKITSGNYHKHKLNYTESTALYNFSNFLKEKYPQYVNLEWIFDYFNYQFTKWSFIKEQKEREGDSYIIMLHWVLGKKSFSNFLKKTKTEEYFYHSSFYPKYQIKKIDLENKLLNIEKDLIISDSNNFVEKDKVTTKSELFPIEEHWKGLKYNTVEGFSYCLINTTLFKFNSEFCLNCIFKEKCKNILKENYKELYEKRLENKLIFEK